MARTLKLYKLPEHPLTPGLRPLVRTDVPQVHLASLVLVCARVACLVDCPSPAQWTPVAVGCM